MEQLSAAQGSSALRPLHTEDKYLGAGFGNDSPGASIQAPAEPGVPKARFDRLTELNHLMIGKVEKLRAVSACAEAAAATQRLHVFFTAPHSPHTSPRIHLTLVFFAICFKTAGAGKVKVRPRAPREDPFPVHW